MVEIAEERADRGRRTRRMTCSLRRKSSFLWIRFGGRGLQIRLVQYTTNAGRLSGFTVSVFLVFLLLKHSQNYKLWITTEELGTTINSPWGS